MPVFKSKQPDIDLPTDITTWEWLFGDKSPASPLNRFRESALAGYTDAVTKERVSWKDVKTNATHISTALAKRYGFRRGDTLSLFSRNTIWYPVTLFAAIRIGGVVSGASPAYNVEEMTYALNTASAKFLATHPASMEVALKAAEAVGIPKKHIFLLEGDLAGFTTIKELISIGKAYGSGGQAEEAKIPAGKKNKDACAILSFSSGTTGLPKAVMIAHQNIIAQALQIQQLAPPGQERGLAVLPLFHITGIVHTMHVPIILNTEVIMLPAFSMEAMLRTVVEYRISELLLVPPILIQLVRNKVVDNYDLSHVRLFSSGAAPLSEEIIQLLKTKFPGTGFKQGYGMTESCSCITAHPPDKFDYKYAHRVGTIVASTEVKLIKDDGTEAGIGEPGEILARGPQVVMGYLNNPKATAENFDKDGFLHTGDQGFIDDEGFITVTDRIKELIKVKAISVAPAELEDLLLGHPIVEDCAVTSIPDERTGERPKAFVVLKKGATAGRATGMDLIRYVEENKTRHKWVKEVEFIETIPKSASGKILRRVLKKQAKDARRSVIVKADDPSAKL